ncbi:MAG TPA: hypothetical protein VFT55_09695 [Planctomycetota bacterium]|nr:hypothetical protein [Planctomycetota bacterium]
MTAPSAPPITASSVPAGQFAHAFAERLERAQLGVELRILAPRVVDRRTVLG